MAAPGPPCAPAPCVASPAAALAPAPEPVLPSAGPVADAADDLHFDSDESLEPAGLTLNRAAQWQARHLVRRYVTALLRHSRWQHSSGRVLVNHAMDLISKHGKRCWGADTAYSRRRSLADSFLQYDFDRCKAK
jgi:hypothetical protein